MMHGRMYLSGLAFALVMATGASATAAEGPWYAGTTPERRAEARAAFDEGVRFLMDAFFSRAADRLRASLAAWDHPGTHFNLSKTLMNLDQPVEAVTHMWAAMRHGGAPLTLDQIEQLERYAGLILETEVAHVVIRSDRAGPVLLDGRKLFEGPGRWEGLVVAKGLTAEVGGARLAVPGVASGQRVEIVFPRKGDPTHTERRATPDDLAALQKHLLGFVVRYPTEAERQARRQAARPTPTRDAGDALPAPSASLCARAQGDLLTVCQQYAADRKALVQLQSRGDEAARAAIERLKEATGGGIVTTLE